MLRSISFNEIVEVFNGIVKDEGNNGELRRRVKIPPVSLQAGRTV